MLVNKDSVSFYANTRYKSEGNNEIPDGIRWVVSIELNYLKEMRAFFRENLGLNPADFTFEEEDIPIVMTVNDPAMVPSEDWDRC